MAAPRRRGGRRECSARCDRRDRGDPRLQSPPARSLSEMGSQEAREPSALAAWSRARVVGHLIQSTGAYLRLIALARDGVEPGPRAAVDFGLCWDVSGAGPTVRGSGHVVLGWLSGRDGGASLGEDVLLPPLPGRCPDTGMRMIGGPWTERELGQRQVMRAGRFAVVGRRRSGPCCRRPGWSTSGGVPGGWCRRTAARIGGWRIRGCARRGGR